MADEINNKTTEKTGANFTREEAGAVQKLFEDSVPNLSLSDRTAQGQENQKFSDKIDMKQMFGKLENAEPILSRTEKLIMNGLQKAIDKADVDSVQEMLGALSENPASLSRVMKALQNQMESRDPLTSVGWESGTDNKGNQFVRLHLQQRNDWSKSSGSTDLTIGSDGRNSAQYTKSWDSKPAAMSPSEALSNIGAGQNRGFRDNESPRHRQWEKEPFLPNYESSQLKLDKLQK